MGAMNRVHDFSSARRTLELGCGNAFGSALIAEGRERVVASDLYRERVQTHSIDLRKARQLLDGLGLQRCDVAAASGEALPFADGAFDLVFSLFVMEHVPDRAACLHEIRRVLAPGGVTVHAVPGTMWALSAPFRFPFYLLGRLLARALPQSSRPNETRSSGPASHPLEKMTWALFRRRYPAFPLPPPHGEYRSYLEELRAYRRRSWVALFERHGFDVLTCAPLTMCSPDLFLRMSSPATRERLLAWDTWLASKSGLGMFGQFFVIVARPKERGSRSDG